MAFVIGCQNNLSSTKYQKKFGLKQKNLTYQNSQLGFSFSYPKGYQLQKNEQTVYVWKDADYLNIDDFVKINTIDIGIVDNPENLSPMEWAKKHYLIEGKVTEQLVASSEAVAFTWSGMWVFRSIVLSHREPGKLIMITWDQEMTEYKAVFDQIVSSFKLL
ncbi:MAG: hypothetical protein F6K52_22585 [Moorea sp. SIO3H5]|nr:hypothetical protein [Moorena sp. SIO3H5]